MTESDDKKGKITRVRRGDVPHTYGHIVPGTYEGSELFFQAVEVLNAGYEMLQRVQDGSDATETTDVAAEPPKVRAQRLGIRDVAKLVLTTRK